MTTAARQMVSLSRYFIRAALRLLLASSLVLWSQAPGAAQDRQIEPQPQAGQDEPDRNEPDRGPERNGDDPAAQSSPQFGEEVVVVGSRARPRSVTESTVPIDVVPAADVVRQGDSNLGNQLRVLLPSFNVNAPRACGASRPTIRWCS